MLELLKAVPLLLLQTSHLHNNKPSGASAPCSSNLTTTPHQRQPIPLKTYITTINNKIPIIHSSHLSSQFVDHLDGNAEVTLQRANKCEIILFGRLIIVCYFFYFPSLKYLITFQFSLLFLRQNLILSPVSLFSFMSTLTAWTAPNLSDSALNVITEPET